MKYTAKAEGQNGNNTIIGVYDETNQRIGELLREDKFNNISEIFNVITYDNKDYVMFHKKNDFAQMLELPSLQFVEVDMLTMGAPTVLTKEISKAFNINHGKEILKVIDIKNEEKNKEALKTNKIKLNSKEDTINQLRIVKELNIRKEKEDIVLVGILLRMYKKNKNKGFEFKSIVCKNKLEYYFNLIKYGLIGYKLDKTLTKKK